MDKKTEHDLRNSRGVIAAHYRDLQALPIIEQSKISSLAKKSSPDSYVRAILQSAEVALLNISNLLERASIKIKENDFLDATNKIRWVRDFHTLLIKLSMLLPDSYRLPISKYGVLNISSSLGYQNFLTALKLFDSTILLSSKKFDAQVFSEDSSHQESTLVHLLMICNHDTSIWSRKFSEIIVSKQHSDYREFSDCDSISRAVFDRTLTGDTYFLQFRGLHQIPEILCAELNDHLESAIICIDQKRISEGIAHIKSTNDLLSVVVSSLHPIIDNLLALEYYKIRENLGLTSGSHSVNLHYHLFHDLYNQLGDTVKKFVLEKSKDDELSSRLLGIFDSKNDNEKHFVKYSLLENCLKTKKYLYLWRDLHMHLPRSNLGGTKTKSLTGSTDAVKTVKKMKAAAMNKDPFAFLDLVVKDRNDLNVGSVIDYLESDSSLDTYFLAARGQVTQKSFEDVQKRLGVFAEKVSFSPPPKRDVKK